MTLSLEDQMLYSDSLEARRNAAITLSKNPSLEMVSAFLRALADSEEIAIFAMLGLVKIGPVVLPHVLETLQTSSHTATRVACIDILGEFCDPRALPILLELAEKEKNVWVQSAAIQALTGYHDKSVEELLVRLLSYPDSWIMTLAAVNLHKRGYTVQNLFNILLEKFIQIGETRRGVMAWGLIEIGNQKDISNLKTVIPTVQDPHVQKMLQETLKHLSWKKA